MKDLFENIELPVEKKLELLQSLLKQVQQPRVRGAEVPVTPASEQAAEPAATFEAIEESMTAPESAPSEEAPPYQDDVPFDNAHAVADEDIELTIQTPAEMAAEATEQFEESRKAADDYVPMEQPKTVAFDVPEELKQMEVTSTSEILREQMLQAQATVKDPLPEEGPEKPGLIKEEISRDDAFKAFAAADGIEAPVTPEAAPISMDTGEESVKEKPVQAPVSAAGGGGLITDDISDDEAFKAFAAADKPATAIEEAPKTEAPPPEVAISDFFGDADDSEAQAQEETAQAAPAEEEKVMTIGDFFADEPDEEEPEEPGTLGDFFSGMD